MASIIFSKHGNKSEIWFYNVQPKKRIIPKGMVKCQAKKFYIIIRVLNHIIWSLQCTSLILEIDGFYGKPFNMDYVPFLCSLCSSIFRSLKIRHFIKYCYVMLSRCWPCAQSKEV